MSKLVHCKVVILTDADGDFVQDTPFLSGRILQMWYDFGNLDNTLDLTITGAATGMPIISFSNIPAADRFIAPRQPTHDKDTWVASLYAGAGEPVEDYIWVHEQLTVLVAQGGNIQTGDLHIWVG